MATRKDQEAVSSVIVYLVVKRRPLSEQPALWRWLARLVYWRIGWASDYGVEYQGVYTDEGEARHAASGAGMSYTALPLDQSLPEETCQFRTHDFPVSDASAKYRRRALPFVAIPVKDLQSLVLLENKIDDLHDCLDGKCLKVT